MSLLKIKNLSVTYKIGNKYLKVLNNVSLDVNSKQIFGIIGESGCGKSTLAKSIVSLLKPSNGEILIDNNQISKIKNKERTKLVQMIFQDTTGSLNPRKKVFDTISEPLLNQNISKKQIANRVNDILQNVGLEIYDGDKYPHMFSGGQRQRIGIARALISNPKLVICDEPVSALDVSIQAQIINLLLKLQDKYNLTYIFISHDLSVVRHICDHLAIMYLGKIVETSSVENIFKNPLHPYTQALIESSPSIDKKEYKKNFQGEPPSFLKIPSGCSFHQRCPHVIERCKTDTPLLELKYSNHKVSCHEV